MIAFFFYRFPFPQVYILKYNSNSVLYIVLLMEFNLPHPIQFISCFCHVLSLLKHMVIVNYAFI